MFIIGDVNLLTTVSHNLPYPTWWRILNQARRHLQATDKIILVFQCRKPFPGTEPLIVCEAVLTLRAYQIWVVLRLAPGYEGWISNWEPLEDPPMARGIWEWLLPLKTRFCPGRNQFIIVLLSKQLRNWTYQRNYSRIWSASSEKIHQGAVEIQNSCPCVNVVFVFITFR